MLLWTLFACGAGWLDQTPACGKDVYEWSDDLLDYILTGDGSGSFDFDPPDVPRQQIAGAYHASKGNFSYSTTYAGNYWLSTSDTSGYGTVYHNGDLDLLFQTDATDSLDRSSTSSTRLQRTHCKVEWSTWSGAMDDTEASVLTHAGEFVDANTFQWSADTDESHLEGENRQDLTATSTYAANDGSAEATTDYDPAGTSHSDWSSDCYDSYTCEGTTDTKYNGDFNQSYTVLDGKTKIADFSWDYSFDGSGTGKATFYDAKDVSCDYTLASDGKCTYTCDDKSKGSCSG